jgi:hypothetical protein
MDKGLGLKGAALCCSAFRACLKMTLCNQFFQNTEPFRIEWFSAYRLSRPTVPTVGVTLIAFFAMQVGVHPRALGPLSCWADPCARFPITFAVPPKSGEGECESDWRRG